MNDKSFHKLKYVGLRIAENEHKALCNYYDYTHIVYQVLLLRRRIRVFGF
jgi:hypothetical protein